LTFAHGLKVKSLGILYLILPLGAFCEPDEEQLKKTEIKRRMHVYAAGPMSNFAVAIVIFMIFSLAFMGSVQAHEGVHVLYNIEDSPADTINITAGSVITEINGSAVMNVTMFTSLLQNISINQTVPITYYKDGSYFTKNVTLVSQYHFTNDKNDTNDSFLGVGFNLYVNGYLKALQQPLRYAFPDGLILVYSLPFFSYLIGYNPIVSPFTGGYVIQGPLSFLPTNLFWIIVNALYWIFWINLVVGLFNVLPMIPLDGGFLLSDALRGVIKRVKGSIKEEKREYIVRNITLFISLIILFVVLFPWIIKYF